MFGESRSASSRLRGKVGPRAEEEKEAESTLSAAEWLRFIQQLLLLRLAARTAGTGHQSPGVGTRCPCFGCTGLLLLEAAVT